MEAVKPDRRKAPRAEDSERRGRRSQPRAAVNLPITIATLDGNKRISLLEVSLSGARLEGTALPHVGKYAVLMCGAVEAFGTVVWATENRCGMQFDEPITLSELVALRRVAVKVEDSGITPEEIQAVADWESGLAR
jgi:hypothetical protein